MTKQINSNVSNSAYFLRKLAYQGKYNNIPTTIDLIRYNTKDVTIKKIGLHKEMQNEILHGSVSWFKITGFTDVEKISGLCKNFGIHRFDIKDLLSDIKVTKIVTYENVTFILVSGCFFKGQQLEVEQIAFILGENYILSFQESDSPVFKDIVTAIRESLVQIRENGADYLLYILLNSVHATYINAISKIDDDLDEMEQNLIENQITDKKAMSFFSYTRKNSSIIRRVITPIREEFPNLLHNPNKLIKAESFIYFNDYDDRLRTTLEELEIVNESVKSLMDLYFNNNNLKMNEIMKRLTVVSTIFIPLTFLVGVWGMNFRFMPELEWEYGYIFSWIVIAAVALIAILFLKKKKWF